MKVVVIGGSGLIGKKLIPLLRQRGHEAVSASPSSGVNALTGEVVWQYDLPTAADYPNNGGLLATPVLGQGEIADLVIFNVSKTTDSRLCLLGRCLGDVGLVPA